MIRTNKTFYDFMTAFCWAFGMFASVCTRWRLSGVPVGAGEVILLLASVLTFIKYRASFWFSCLAGFLWSILSIGFISQIVQKEIFPDAHRDWFSYTFCALVVTAFYQFIRLKTRLMAKCTFYAALLSIALLLLSLLSSIFGGNPWMYKEVPWVRFCGYSQRITQVGLYLIPLVFLLGCFKRMMATNYLILLTGVIVSLMTWAGTMALTFTFFTTCIVVLFFSLLWKIDRRKFIYVVLIAGLSHVVTINSVVYMNDGKFYSMDLFSQCRDKSEEGLVDRSPRRICFGQIELSKSKSFKSDKDMRFTHWVNGIRAGITHPFIGLGPGLVSGYDGPFGGRSAHNSYVALFTATGVFGAIIFFVWIFRISLSLFKSKNLWLIGVEFSILLYGCFSNYLRHPTFWMYLILCAVLGSKSVTADSKPADNK